MLRSTRGLLILAIAIILGAVGTTYFRQKKTLARQAVVPPKSLPLNTDAAATDWVWKKDEGTNRAVEVRARHFRQVNDPARLELENVELRLYKNSGKEYDLVRSAKAFFDPATGTLYSDGEVEITKGVPADNTPHGRLLTIHSSGVTYDSRSGTASTERPASFAFDLGEGKAVGASYNPNTRELLMKSQVELQWRGKDAKARPMTLAAGELLYREAESTVLLRPWAKLSREKSVLESQDAVVHLKDGLIQRVEARQAHGTDQYPNRQLEYSADNLTMNFSEDGEVQQIIGEPAARLLATSDTARTTITSDRVELNFDVTTGESVLAGAVATGNGTLESAPLPRKNIETPETRVLRSSAIRLAMRPGGREVDHVQTEAPGRLEFLPNRPGQRHRTLDADRMTIAYGPDNQIQSFRAAMASTRTDPEPPRDKRPAGPPILTTSKNLAAQFDPKTGQLARLEQWDDFRYEEGARRARASKAVLEEARDLITLEQSARAWDETGSTTADRIVLDQKTGRTTAGGNVVSTRMPDSKGKSSSMLSADEPLQATAQRMETSDRNRRIRYEGQAVAWQGANRIWADTIDIDRIQRKLMANGHVRTQLIDQQKSGAQRKPAGAAAPTFITIEAAALVYTEADRLAHYTGGVHLVRPGMDVKAAEIRAWLNDQKAESSLDHAFADGKVEILRRDPDRTLDGTAEHAEYYTADQRIVLNGGQPRMIDSLRGATTGTELTYFINDDKLLVDGAERQPVVSRIRRRKSSPPQ